MNNSPEKSKGLTTREAIFIVVGFVLGSAGAATYFLEKGDADSAKKPEVSKLSDGESDDVGEDQICIKRNKSSKWAPPCGWMATDEFDERSEEAVALCECRALFREKVLVDENGIELPNCNPMSEDEILQEAHGIETERRAIKAEAIIDRYCISDPEDQEELRDEVMRGFSRNAEVYQFKDGTWQMGLDSSEDESFSTGFELMEKPMCGMEEEKRHEYTEGERKMLKMIKENRFAELWGEKVDVEWRRDQVNDVGAEGELGEFLDFLDTVPSRMDEKDPALRKLAACQLMYDFLMIAEKLEQMPPEVESKIDGIQGLGDSFRGVEMILEAFTQSQGVDDFENCAMIVMEHNRGMIK